MPVLGMKMESEPVLIPVTNSTEQLRKAKLAHLDYDRGEVHIHFIQNALVSNPNLKCVFVLVSKLTQSAKIKQFLNSKGIVSQFMYHRTIEGEQTVKHEIKPKLLTLILKQLISKMGLDLYRIEVPDYLRD